MTDTQCKWTPCRLNDIFSAVPKKNREVLIQPNTVYRLATVRLYSKGISLRKVTTGDKIGVKRLYKVSKGDFVFSKIDARNGAYGFVSNDLDGLLVSHDFPILQLNHRVASEQFVSQLLSKPNVWRFIGIDAIGTTNRQRVSEEQFLAYEISLPPLAEQTKIAAILTSVDDAITTTQRIIAQTEVVKRGLMQQLLTKGIGHTTFKQTEIGEIPTEWELRTVGDLVKFEGGSQPPRDTFEFEPREGNIRLIQIRDYKTDKYATYVPRELARKFCSKDDVMIGRYGPPIFQILRGIEGAYNVALIKAVPNEQFVTKDYLYYFLKQESLFRLIDGLSQRTSGQTGVDMDALKNFAFPLPPVAEQQRIVEILGNQDFKLNHETRYIDQLNTVKNSLMQVLLTGKERVHVDESPKVSV